jgi:hypothetical protein
MDKVVIPTRDSVMSVFCSLRMVWRALSRASTVSRFAMSSLVCSISGGEVIVKFCSGVFF